MNKKVISSVVVVLLLFSGFGYSQKQAAKDTVEIIILHTNDMHAKIDSMAKLAYLADSLRKTHPFVFLVSAGDNFTGNPVVDLVEDKGYPMIDLMNQCGFNVSAIGNHEFDLGQEFLNKRIMQASFPFISANIDATGAILKQPKPYLILNRGNGDSIAFLSLIELGENGLPDSHPSKLIGLKFTDGVEKAKEFGWLKDKYGILIVLSHLGIETDMKLAESFPQFDLIIGGHSHSLIDTLLKVNGVMIVQAGSGLKYVGKTTLFVNQGHAIKLNEEIIPLSVISENEPRVKASIDKYNSNEEFKKVIGNTEQPVSGFEELGSMMADALKSQMKVDFAFHNRFGLRIPSLNHGAITLADIYRLDPFQNQVVIFSLSGTEIQSLIRYAFNLKNIPDLAVAGMKYTVLTDSINRYIDIEMIDDSGFLVKPGNHYSVAVNSYVAAGYRFDHRDPGKTLQLTTEQALIGYLQKIKTINYIGVKRTFVKTVK